MIDKSFRVDSKELKGKDISGIIVQEISKIPETRIELNQTLNPEARGWPADKGVTTHIIRGSNNSSHFKVSIRYDRGADQFHSNVHVYVDGYNESEIYSSIVRVLDLEGKESKS